jgi:transcription elongation factor Elf1
MLTQEQKDNYIKNKDFTCPYCGESLVSNGHEWDYGKVYYFLQCPSPSCGVCYRETHTLIDIEEE